MVICAQDYTALRNTWMRDRDAFLLVFSVTERTTFEDLKGFYEQLCVMHEEKLPPIIIGTTNAVCVEWCVMRSEW